jgi:hypothetical protein
MERGREESENEVSRCSAEVALITESTEGFLQFLFSELRWQ